MEVKWQARNLKDIFWTLFVQTGCCCCCCFKLCNKSFQWGTVWANVHGGINNLTKLCILNICKVMLTVGNQLIYYQNYSQDGIQLSVWRYSRNSMENKFKANLKQKLTIDCVFNKLSCSAGLWLHRQTFQSLTYFNRWDPQCAIHLAAVLR